MMTVGVRKGVEVEEEGGDEGAREGGGAEGEEEGVIEEG